MSYRCLRSWNLEHGALESLAAARNDFLSFLQATAEPSGSDITAALLIFGELTSNAVEHGRGKVAATLFALGAATALRVADEGSGFEVSTTSATDAMRGRGLFFVKTLAQSLVVETGASVVEAVLPVRLRGGMESPRA